MPNTKNLHDYRVVYQNVTPSEIVGPNLGGITFSKIYSAALRPAQRLVARQAVIR